ncbi:hypothetical protein B0H14DRAFT_2794993, partial [Mycena olivaceomarginata]
SAFSVYATPGLTHAVPPTLGPSERLTFISHGTTLPLIFTSLHTSFLFCSILNLAVTIIVLANADSLLLFFYCSSVSWFRPTIVLIFVLLGSFSLYLYKY